MPVRLDFSNRSEDEILNRDELDSLAKQNPNFRVIYTLTRSSADGWRGLTGRINGECLQETAKGLDRPIYYISGTPSMVVGTYRLLEGLGISGADIEVEAFRGYG